MLLKKNYSTDYRTNKFEHKKVYTLTFYDRGFYLNNSIENLETNYEMFRQTVCNCINTKATNRELFDHTEEYLENSSFGDALSEITEFQKKGKS